MASAFVVGQKVEALYKSTSKNWKIATVRRISTSTLTLQFDGWDDLTDVPPKRVRFRIQKRSSCERDDRVLPFKKVSRIDHSSAGQEELNSARSEGSQYKFFHGTSWDNALNIQRNGFKISTTGCLGPGVYVARRPKAERFAKDYRRHEGNVGGSVV